MALQQFVVNIQAAIFQGDSWLVIERGANESQAPGALAFVGGKVENPDVNTGVLEDTLKREVREEVGIEVHPDMHYLHSTFFIADRGEPVINVVFLCEYASGEPTVISRDEVENIFWIPSEKLLEHPQTPDWTKRTIGLAESLRMKLKQKEKSLLNERSFLEQVSV